MAARRHQAYDPATETWQDVAPLPVTLDHIQGAAVDGKVYYVGGLRDWPGPHVSSVHVYDTATNRFSRGAPMPRGRGAGGVVAHGGKVYYAGGLSDGRAVPWLDAYDPATRHVVPAAGHAARARPLPGSGRRRTRSTRSADARDLSGARSPRPTPTTSRRANGKATSRLFPRRRGGFAAAALGDTVYVIGGETPGRTLTSVEAYDTRTDTWHTLDPMPTARHGVQAAVCDGGIFVAAGGAVAESSARSLRLRGLRPRDDTACGREGEPTSEAPGFAPFGLEGAVLRLADVPPVRTGRAALRVPAERPDQGVHRRAASRGNYRVIATEAIDAIQSIPNHDDDGSSATDFDATLRVLWQKLTS